MWAALTLLAVQWCVRLPAAAALSRVQSPPGDDALNTLDDTVDLSPGDDFSPGDEGWHRLIPNARGVTIHPQTVQKSNVSNTAVYMATSDLSEPKVEIIQELVRVSPYPLVIGYDVKKGTMSQQTKAALKMLAKGTGKKLTVVPVSDHMMRKKYGDKIDNYNGYYPNNPGKLAVMDWVASSPYEFAWHLEDDVWAHGLDTVASSLASFDDDLIITPRTTLPLWAAHGWRIGDRSKLASGPPGTMLACNPSIFRMSKHFAKKVVDGVFYSTKVNHHEVWYPYIVQRYNLSWSPLTFVENLKFNSHTGTHFRFCVDDLKSNRSVWLVHPVKCNHHEK